MTNEQRETQLASRLRDARSRTNKSQREVAEYLGLSREAITEVEQGRRSVKALELARLAALYRTTPNRLLKGLAEVEG